jgi:hypothetical protein
MEKSLQRQKLKKLTHEADNLPCRRIPRNVFLPYEGGA